MSDSRLGIITKSFPSLTACCAVVSIGRHAAVQINKPVLIVFKLIVGTNQQHFFLYLVPSILVNGAFEKSTVAIRLSMILPSFLDRSDCDSHVSLSTRAREEVHAPHRTQSERVNDILTRVRSSCSQEITHVRIVKKPSDVAGETSVLMKRYCRDRNPEGVNQQSGSRAVQRGVFSSTIVARRTWFQGKRDHRFMATDFDDTDGYHHVTAPAEITPVEGLFLFT